MAGGWAETVVSLDRAEMGYRVLAQDGHAQVPLPVFLLQAPLLAVLGRHLEDQLRVDHQVQRRELLVEIGRRGGDGLDLDFDLAEVLLLDVEPLETGFDVIG